MNASALGLPWDQFRRLRDAGQDGGPVTGRDRRLPGGLRKLAELRRHGLSRGFGPQDGCELAEDIGDPDQDGRNAASGLTDVIERGIDQSLWVRALGDDPYLARIV